MVPGQDLFRRLTLDVIGITGFRYDFQALGAQGSADGRGDPIELWRTITDVSRLLVLDLPVPPEWVPGYGRFDAAIAELDQIILDILQTRKDRGVQVKKTGLGRSRELAADSLCCFVNSWPIFLDNVFHCRGVHAAHSARTQGADFLSWPVRSDGEGTSFSALRRTTGICCPICFGPGSRARRPGCQTS